MLKQYVVPTGPPCRKFTPKLIEFYKNLKADNNKGGESFELVFVSLDRSEAEYKDYTSDMPWMCTPFSLPKDLKSKLQKKVWRPRHTAPSGS